ncbi:type II toxin-antitoxin system VapC family toxin [Leptospirillum ferrooxidans]|jgi:predicted nucleic acid-binding protein|uniref:Putative PilT protein domain protein n=1 Tax=Leptospirillum ferrooxidans (strain C2-3) TaxID=1162668 RepID=I0IP41_LEPFC|nr:type II toxin-antitoxin system VapC family toxin [Leptospirillum ferrooxidans]BAM07040.1 putative PilT protein domain protein [Leptospirillum ferrooxidans C2-3]
MNFVLDNSITMRWFFGDGMHQELAYATGVLSAMEANVAVVPVIWRLEVSNVLARAEWKGLVTEARSSSFLSLLSELDIEVDMNTVDHALSDTLQLARRYALSSYDASYLELALRHGLSLASLDEDLMKAAEKSGVKRFVP